MTAPPFVKLEDIILTSRDRFAVYGAEHEFVKFISKDTLKDGLDVLEVLLDTKIPVTTYRGLEICRHCFTKRPHLFFLIPAEFKSKLLSTMSFLLTDQNNSNDIYIYEVVSLALKVHKLQYKNLPYSLTDAANFVSEFLTSNLSKLQDLLFNLERKDFARRRILKLFWNVLECQLWNNNNNITSNCIGYCLAESLHAHIVDRDLRELLLRRGQTEFIGHVEGSGGIEGSCGYDMMQIREWSYMCICTVAVVQSKAGIADEATTPLALLSRLDTLVADALSIPRTYWLPWLSVVYSDQDDLWIKVLMVLLDMLQCMTEYQISLHMHFLQLVDSLGYDHLVLVDLLTSPETKFREYLVKYLKYLSNDWNKFITSLTMFTRTGEIGGGGDTNDLEQGNGDLEKDTGDSEHTSDPEHSSDLDKDKGDREHKCDLNKETCDSEKETGDPEHSSDLDKDKGDPELRGDPEKDASDPEHSSDLDKDKGDPENDASDLDKDNGELNKNTFDPEHIDDPEKDQGDLEHTYDTEKFTGDPDKDLNDLEKETDDLEKVMIVDNSDRTKAMSTDSDIDDSKSEKIDWEESCESKIKDTEEMVEDDLLDDVNGVELFMKEISDSEQIPDNVIDDIQMDQEESYESKTSGINEMSKVVVDAASDENSLEKTANETEYERKEVIPTTNVQKEVIPTTNVISAGLSLLYSYDNDSDSDDEEMEENKAVEMQIQTVEETGKSNDTVDSKSKFCDNETAEQTGAKNALRYTQNKLNKCVKLTSDPCKNLKTKSEVVNRPGTINCASVKMENDHDTMEFDIESEECSHGQRIEDGDTMKFDLDSNEPTQRISIDGKLDDIDRVTNDIDNDGELDDIDNVTNDIDNVADGIDNYGELDDIDRVTNDIDNDGELDDIDNVTNDIDNVADDIDSYGELDDIDKVTNNIDNVTDDINRVTDNMDDDEDDNDSNSDTDSEINDNHRPDNVEVLDKVIGMLIRVRYKLERLASAELLPFKPNAINAWIMSVETIYEEYV